jgi:hypothetical protein
MGHRTSSTRRASSSTRRCAHGTPSGTGPSTSWRARPSRSAPAAARLRFYWEDVDLALRLRLAGWGCVRAPDARALHKHGQTLGAASPAQRRLEAFGRAFVLARFRVARRGLATRMKIAALDWPVLAVHLVVRREAGPIRERIRGTRAGLARPPLRAPLELATVSFHEALRRQANQLRLRFTGALPSHFDESAPAAD